MAKWGEIIFEGWRIRLPVLANLLDQQKPGKGSQDQPTLANGLGYLCKLVAMANQNEQMTPSMQNRSSGQAK